MTFIHSVSNWQWLVYLYNFLRTFFFFILLIPFQCFFLLLLIYIVIFINTFLILIIHVLSCFCCLFYSFHNRFEHPCQAIGCIELFDNFFHLRWKSYSWFWRQLWYVTSAIDSLSKTNYLLAMSTDEGKLKVNK